MNSEVIAKRLKQMRGSKTQLEVSNEVGIKQNTYAMYETGKRIPSDENKIKLAKYFGTTVQQIFFDEEAHVK